MTKQKEVETLVLHIAKVLLLCSLKKKADRSEREFILLQEMACTRPFYGVCKKPDCVCPRRSTTDEIDQSKKEDDNREFFVCGRFSLHPLSTVPCVVLVVSSNYKVKPFRNALQFSYLRLWLGKLVGNETVSKHRLDSETVT